MLKEKFHAISLLKPWDINISKIRIGPDRDGGYILADKFDPANQPVLSYGISDELGFEIEMADRGHQVFMFDHTIDDPKPLEPGMTWFKEGVSGRFESELPGFLFCDNDPDNNTFTIEHHLEKTKVQGNRLILKLDVESSEFGAIFHLSSPSLLRFEQILIEVHGLHGMEKSVIYRTAFINVFEKLNKHFTLFHVHANNVDGAESFLYVGGMPVTNLIELSYVRTDLIERAENNTVYPTKLDYPGQPNIRDKLMWIFPFLPNNPDRGAYKRSWEHVNSTDPARFVPPKLGE